MVDMLQMWTGFWCRFRRWGFVCYDGICMYATAVCVYIDWCSRVDVWLLLQFPDLLVERKKKREELVFLTHKVESALFHDSSVGDFISPLKIFPSP